MVSFRSTNRSSNDSNHKHHSPCAEFSRLETAETRVREQLELYRCIPCHDAHPSLAGKTNCQEYLTLQRKHSPGWPSMAQCHAGGTARSCQSRRVLGVKFSQTLPCFLPFEGSSVDTGSRKLLTTTKLCAYLHQTRVCPAVGPQVCRPRWRVLRGVVVLEHSRIPPGMHQVGGLLEGTTSSWTSRRSASLRESERLHHTSSSTKLRSLHFWFVENGARQVHGRSGEYTSLRSRGSS